MMKSSSDAVPSYVKMACAHKNITDVSEACNCAGAVVVPRSYGCKEDTATVLGAYSHNEDIARAGACHQNEDTARVVGAYRHKEDTVGVTDAS